MLALVYSLCLITSFLCAWLLLRRYFQCQLRLLLWTGLYFVVLTLNTLLLMVEKLVFVSLDIRIVRLSIALIGIMLLMYGLIFESEEEG